MEISVINLEICFRDSEGVPEGGPWLSRMEKSSGGVTVVCLAVASLRCWEWVQAGRGTRAMTRELPQGSTAESELEIVFLQIGSDRGWGSNSKIAAPDILTGLLKFGA